MQAVAYCDRVFSLQHDHQRANLDGRYSSDDIELKLPDIYYFALTPLGHFLADCSSKGSSQAGLLLLTEGPVRMPYGVELPWLPSWLCSGSTHSQICVRIS